MTCLLHVDHRTILTPSLVCLSQYWIQWLLIDFLQVKVTDLLSHEKFHSLYWVVGHRSPVYIDGESTLQSWHEFKLRCWAHTLDWKTDSREVSPSCQDSLTDHLQELRCSTSEFLRDHWVCVGEATIVSSIWTSVLISLCKWLPVLSKLQYEFLALSSGHFFLIYLLLL